MKRLDQTVKRETLYIAAWTLVLSALMESVFLVIGLWKPSVLFGNLISGAAAVLNFLLMGVTVQNAVEKDEKDAASLMRFSQSMRMLMQLAAAAVGVMLFDPVASIVPLFFPRIAVMFRPMFSMRSDGAQNGDASDERGAEEERGGEKGE